MQNVFMVITIFLPIIIVTMTLLTIMILLGFLIDLFGLAILLLIFLMIANVFFILILPIFASVSDTKMAVRRHRNGLKNLDSKSIRFISEEKIVHHII